MTELLMCGRRGRWDIPPSHHHDAHAPSAMHQPTLNQLLHQRERNDHALSQSLHMSTIADGQRQLHQREKDNHELKRIHFFFHPITVST